VQTGLVGTTTRRLVVLVIVTVVVTAGIVLGLSLSDQGASQVPQAAQLKSVRTACTRWLEASPAQPGTSQWCTDMVNWMSRYGTVRR
jgi:hypothetical protein